MGVWDHEDAKGSLCVGASCWVFVNLGCEFCADDVGFKVDWEDFSSRFLWL